MHHEHLLASLSDDELLRRLAEILNQSRRVEADLVAHIGEVERRRLFAREASPSMFSYCTNTLHLSEAEAYLRIGAARAAREHPVILEMLADGRLHLSGIEKLASHLTQANRDSLLLRAAGKTKRQIEELLVEIAFRPDVQASIRRLPRIAIQPEPGSIATIHPGPCSVAATHPGTGPVPAPQLRPDGVGSSLASGSAPVVQPLAPSRYKIQFTASALFEEKLKRLQALMPNRDLAGAIEQAVTEKLERLENRRFGRSAGHKGRSDPRGLWLTGGQWLTRSSLVMLLGLRATYP